MRSTRESRVGTVDVKGLFLGLQEELIRDSKLFRRAAAGHPGSQGQATEASWRKLLADYLPKRYQVSKAFAVDSKGRRSDEIDLMIHDRQYSPFLFKKDGQILVPAESVYAVFEVKPAIDARALGYAADKAASVRDLARFSVETPHAGGIFKRQDPKPILAGLLCTRSDWDPALGVPFRRALTSLDGSRALDLGCVLEHGAFELDLDENREPRVSTPETALVSFLLALQQRLQALGTVATIDIGCYRAALERQA